MSGLKQILVVDDDVDIREVLVETLQEEGFAADGVANGQQALTFLRDERPRPGLILLDLMMPVMDGFGFLEIRQADPDIADIPVIVLTAAGKVLDRLNGYDIEVCLPKPFQLTRLLSAIGACL